MTPVEHIKERLNIVDLIQEYIPLQKVGAQYKARCPFHQEKTPSFSVSEQKQFFHCFGCGKSGDVFAFVQAMENVEFVEALRLLAQKTQVELRGYSVQDRTEKTRLLDCLAEAATYYQELLWSENGTSALAYARSRGLSDDTIRIFGLGYSDESWDGVVKALLQRGCAIADIERAGIALRSGKTGAHIDRFRGRLLYPIHNSYGNVIGFGGRLLRDDPNQAKYINSPQTPLYNKSAILYGLHLAKQAIKKMDAVMLVEGYMDVIGCHQAKMRNVVAASGTALTLEHIHLIQRFTRNVILAFDGDRAGMSAAWRGMQLAIQNGLNVKVLALPEGKDPDDLALHEPDTLRALAGEAKAFMDYAFHTVLSPLDLSMVFHKKQAAQELIPMLALFPDPVERTHYVQLLAERLHVPVHVIQEKLDIELKPKVNRAPKVTGRTIASKQLQARPVQNSNPITKSRNLQLQERLIALISNDSELCSRAIGEPQQVLEEPWLTLYNLVQNQYNRTGTLSLEGIHYSDPKLRTLYEATVMLGEDLYVQMTPQERAEEYDIIVTALTREALKNRIQRAQRRIAAAERIGDDTQIHSLVAELRQLTEQLKKLR